MNLRAHPKRKMHRDRPFRYPCATLASLDSASFRYDSDSEQANGRGCWSSRLLQLVDFRF